VEDIGVVDVPRNHRLKPAASDGVAVPGEILVIRGKDLGRQPTVHIGPKPVSVIRRMADGAIVVRVPLGLRPGNPKVRVSNLKGEGTRVIKLKRFGLAVIPGLDHTTVIEAGTQLATKHGQGLSLTGVRALGMYRLGTAAYVLSAEKGGNAHLTAVNMAAAGGPAVAGSRDLGCKDASLLTVASHADKAATLACGKLVLFDLEDPLRPATWEATPIPKKLLATNITDIAMAPDGKTIAFLLKSTNSAVLADVTDPRRVRFAKPFQVVAEDKASLVLRLLFLKEDITPTQSQQALMVLTGADTASLTVGRHPTRIARFTVTPAASGDALPDATPPAHTSVELKNVPLYWATTFNPPDTQSGTSIRQDPAKMLFFMSSVDMSVFDLSRHGLDTPTGLQQGVQLFKSMPRPAQVLRVDPQGRLEGTRLLGDLEVSGGVAVTTDGRTVLAATCRAVIPATGNKLTMKVVCGIKSRNMRKKTAHFLPLSKPPIKVLEPPFRLGLVTIQP
jgi:hypothetical protein